jgi:large subunit ribosomal protein L15
MPMYRRLPKRGFTNPFKVTAQPVNLKELTRLAGTEVTPETLHAAGIISKRDVTVKLLGSGDADRAYTVSGVKFSATAKTRIEQAGGKISAE